jgi:Glycosyltransferase family 87
MKAPHPIPVWPWGLAALVTIPLAVGALITFGRISGFVLFGDAEWYATAIPALFSSGPLYDPSKLGPHEFAFPPYWNQPPSTALFALLMVLPGGRWMWGAVMVAFVLIGVGTLWPRVGLGGMLLLAPVLLVWLPVPSALAWANVNAMVFGLLALAWRFPRAAGWMVGIAAAVKLVPVLGIAWLIGKRDWRGAAIAVGILVMATLVIVIWKGPGTIGDFVTLRLNEVTPPGDRPRWNPVELLQLPDWVAYASAAVLTVLAIRYASLSLAIIAMLVSVPALHAHYLTWLLVPILGIWLPRFLGWTSARAPNRSGVLLT